MSGVGTISAREARRVVLAAQGFAERPVAAVDAARLKRLTRRLGVLQIDSVNVLVRAHYLPLFSRLGAYRREALDAAAYDGRRRHLFEYWGHEASLLPVELYPLFRWRMAEAEEGARGLGRDCPDRRRAAGLRLGPPRRDRPARPARGLRFGVRGYPRRSLVGLERRQAGARIPVLVGAVDHRNAARFRARLRPAGTRPAPARSWPCQPPTSRTRSAPWSRWRRARSASPPNRICAIIFVWPRLNRNARSPNWSEAGTLRPVEVAGWRHPAYIHAEARRPRKVTARALLAPFDPLVWNRERTERLFGCRYRIEIYTPAHKRQHGYYVLPFLLGEDLVARVDLKADRQAGILRVQAAHLESGAKTATVAPALAESLAELAAWLGLGAIEIAGRGDLSPALAADVQLRP